MHLWQRVGLQTEGCTSQGTWRVRVAGDEWKGEAFLSRRGDRTAVATQHVTV